MYSARASKSDLGGPPRAGRIDAVQALRAVAAILVVVGHSQTGAAGLAVSNHEVFTRAIFLPWGAGVDLFFVISGFIMVYASQRLFARPGGWQEFLRRRFTRVIPLYWLLTTIYLGIIAIAHLKGDPQTFGAGAIAASFLFIPFASAGPGSTAFPVFDLGWTLNYEMFFYLLFAMAIWLRRRAAVLAVAGVLAILVVYGLVWPPKITALTFWSQPIILDFALGAAVAAIRCDGTTWRPWLRWAVFVVAGVVFALDPLNVFSGQGTASNGLKRVLGAGLPAAALMAAAVLGSDVRAPGLGPLVRLGNASYSLYLAHSFVLIAVEKIATKTDLARHIGYWPIVFAAVAISLVVATLVFHLVEEPLSRLSLRLTERWVQPRTRRIASPSQPTTPAGASH